jgi:hypothetical protein
LGRQGQSVTVEGVVTCQQGLLDGDGRRITLEDGDAAILLRLPADAAVPTVGARVRVAGEVGTYYGAPQLAAEGTVAALGRESPAPVVLRRAPVAADEWMLVRVVVQITNVSKNGDTWRAEVSLGAGGTMPVTGVSGSGIPSTAMVEGRNATLTGIVRRAYPTASDQRFALVPRSAADIQLGATPAVSPGPVPTSRPGGGTPAPTSPTGTVARGGTPVPGGGEPGSSVASPAASQAPGASSGEPVATTINRLGSLVGQRVRVGGRVTSVDGPVSGIDDGTGQAVLRFELPADAAAVALAVDQIVNVVGYAAERDLGGLEIVVTAAADVTRAPALPAAPTATASPGSATGRAVSADPTPPGGGALPGMPEPPASGTRLAAGALAGLAAAGLLMVAGAATVLRRRRTTRPPAAAAARPGADRQGPSTTAEPASQAAASDLAHQGEGPERH